MTDEQIIELMARAWFDAHLGTGSYDDADNLDREEAHDCVKAALSAVRSAGMAVVPREPTEAMYAAACDPQAVFKHTKPDERGGKIPLLPAVHYRAMIEAAKGE